MEINIIELCNGKYGLFDDTLIFETGGTDRTQVKISKKSALEIMHTLIDSVGLLNNYAENLICKIDEIVN